MNVYSVINSSDNNTARMNVVEMNSPPSKIVEIESHGNKIYMLTKENSNIPSNSIGVSSLVRLFLKLSFDDVVTVSEFNHTRIHKADVNIKAKQIGSKKISRDKINFDELRLEIKNKFDRLPLNQGLKYFASLALTSLNLTIEITFIGPNKGIYQCCYLDNILEFELYIEDDSGNQHNRKEANCNSCQPDTAAKPRTIERHKKDNSIIDSDFDFEKLGIGGLDVQFKTIFQEAFAARILKKNLPDFGQKVTRGILLYGPPGCGKTLMARKIGEILNATKITIVNGPELKNKFHGQSEENIRNLFKEPEEEMIKIQNGEMSKDDMGLYVIVIDEIDSFVGNRDNSSGDSLNNSLVGQFLSKIDQVDPILENILIIAMTNRKFALDPALLRSGRIETHIEITLPDYEGRKSILNIHSAKLKQLGALHEDVDIDRIARLTVNFTGAELEAVIKKATHYCMSKLIDPKTMKPLKDVVLIIRMDDLLRSISSISPVMGGNIEIIGSIISVPFEEKSEHITSTYGLIKSSIDSYISGGDILFNDTIVRNRPLTISLIGRQMTGKTHMIGHIIKDLGDRVSHLKFINPELALEKNGRMWNLYDEGRRFDTFLMVFDNIENYFHRNVDAIRAIFASNSMVEKKLILIVTTRNVNIHIDLQHEFILSVNL